MLSAQQLSGYNLTVGVTVEEIVPAPLGGWLPAEDTATKLDTEVEAESWGSLVWDLANLLFYSRLGNSHSPPPNLSCLS